MLGKLSVGLQWKKSYELLVWGCSAGKARNFVYARKVRKVKCGVAVLGKFGIRLWSCSKREVRNFVCGLQCEER
jgi:hypothetical protein